MTALYDDPDFFAQYQAMPRSQAGLSAAGEWPTFEKLLPDVAGKRVLDLGCGYGWQCRYVADHGAAAVLGVDASEKMLAVAREKNAAPAITYQQATIQALAAPAGSFDLVLSSLALHYLEDFGAVVAHVHQWLAPGGVFLFTVEHPIFTAEGSQDWLYDKNGAPWKWPVDHYFDEGKREAHFLDRTVTKYHHTLTTFVDTLLTHGFTLQRLVEPQPAPALRDRPDMQTSLRMPMMLIIKAQRQ
ncbi:class I SAM-dependent methyltransferase [Lacticaseibacillus yichunensis]|uniref:Class I SAM-dependent methyltransferase n=1 Tax=Lacticaseibacillus yichunensis TaxID=2486015 RepID=A0ABW4CMH9_9LACO|nr:class I SAM-dependent methyltransferase [Lacticaseibacillus yichunensis]